MPTYDAFELSMAHLCIFREARGESQEAKNGVAAVIRNRAAKKKQTLDRIVLAPWQFSSFNRGDPNATRFPRRFMPLEWKAYQDCVTAMDAEDPTDGATHYFDDSIPTPKWAAQMQFKCKIGRLTFYQE